MSQLLSAQDTYASQLTVEVRNISKELFFRYRVIPNLNFGYRVIPTCKTNTLSPNQQS